MTTNIWRSHFTRAVTVDLMMQVVRQGWASVAFSGFVVQVAADKDGERWCLEAVPRASLFPIDRAWLAAGTTLLGDAGVEACWQAAVALTDALEKSDAPNPVDST